MLANLDKDIFDITWDSVQRRYVISRTSCFHEGPKSMVIHNLEGLFTLRNPMDDFCSRSQHHMVHTSQKEENGLYQQYIPSFCFCMLSMLVGHFVLSDTLKFSQDRPILQLGLHQHVMSSIKILDHSCSLHYFGTPPTPHMLEEVSSWVCITLVKESADIAAISPLALASCTPEDMATMTIPVLDLWSFLKKYILWWGPFLWHLCCNEIIN